MEGPAAAAETLELGLPGPGGTLPTADVALPVDALAEALKTHGTEALLLKDLFLKLFVVIAPTAGTVSGRVLGPPNIRLPISKENLWKAGLQSERSEHSRYMYSRCFLTPPLSVKTKSQSCASRLVGAVRGCEAASQVGLLS